MMDEFLEQFLIILLATELASILFLHLGSRMLNNPIMIKLGQKAHDKKMRALDKMWPLTKIRPALAEDNPRAVTVILSSLIILKSIMCFFLGVIVVFWLPLACLMVPSIIHRHDPDDQGLQAWVKKVSLSQVTSHALAASLGASLFLAGYNGGSMDWDALFMTINNHGNLVMITMFLSLIWATKAGSAETDGILKRGI
jgi:hypothetical protein